MTYFSIGWVCLEGMSHGSNGLGVIIILSMHCAQQPPCIHIAWLPLHLLPMQNKGEHELPHIRCVVTSAGMVSFAPAPNAKQQ